MDPIRFSRLKAMATSPAHYLQAVTEEREDTPAMRFGRAVHTLVLGGPEPVIWDGGIKRGKAWDAFYAEHIRDEILTADEYERAQAVAAAVLANPLAADLLEGSSLEQTVSWTVAGRACRGRLDILNPPRRLVADLKTTTAAGPDLFTRQALRMGYHAQLAWYGDGSRAAGIADPLHHFVIAVEVKPPYAPTVYEIDPQTVEIGRKLWRLWFERVLVCERSGYWPAYSESPLPLAAPDDPEFSLVIDGQEVAA